MDSEALRLKIEEMRQSLIDEKILNDQLMLVEDIFTPYFIETAMVVYLDNSPRYIDIIEQSLEETPLDPTQLEKFLNKLKYCNRFGAEKVPTEVDKVLECCRGNDKEGSKSAFLRFKEEYNILKNKLEIYLELLAQAQVGELHNPPCTRTSRVQ